MRIRILLTNKRILDINRGILVFLKTLIFFPLIGNPAVNIGNTIIPVERNSCESEHTSGHCYIGYEVAQFTVPQTKYPVAETKTKKVIFHYAILNVKSWLEGRKRTKIFA